MVRYVPTSSLIADLRVRAVACLAVAALLTATTASVSASWRWVIVAVGAGLVAFGVNGRDLVVMTTVTLARRPVPPDMSKGTEIAAGDLVAGSWFCRADAYRAARDQEVANAQEAARARTLAEDARRTALDEAIRVYLDEIDRMVEAKRREHVRKTLTSGSTRPPRRFQEPTYQERLAEATRLALENVPPIEMAKLRQAPIAEPDALLAVAVMQEAPDQCRIATLDGTVTQASTGSLYRAVPAAHLPRGDQRRERIAAHVEAVVEFVAAHEGLTRVPDEATLPLVSTEVGWEWFQALRCTQSWGLLQVQRHHPRAWLKSASRAVLGLDVPIETLPLELRLTEAGRLWLASQTGSPRQTPSAARTSESRADD
jgi:hypothetical protein